MKIIQDLKNQILSYYDELVVLLPKLSIGIILLILFYITMRFARQRFIKFIASKADDPLLVNFIDRAIKIFNFILGLLLFLYVIGLVGIATSALGGLGVSAIVVGFAFKDIAENFLAGVMMAFSRPFRVGDTVETNGITGSIVGMDLRETHMKTADGKDVYIPNGQIIKNPLYNFTIDGFLRKQFTIGVDYSSDLQEVRNTILEVMKTMDGVIQEEKAPKTIINELGSSTVNVVVQYWIDTFDDKHSSTEIQSQAMNKVLKTLDSKGINMPGDIIEIKNYNKESLNLGESKTA